MIIVRVQSSWLDPSLSLPTPLLNTCLQLWKWKIHLLSLQLSTILTSRNTIIIMAESNILGFTIHTVLHIDNHIFFEIKHIHIKSNLIKWIINYECNMCSTSNVLRPSFRMSTLTAMIRSATKLYSPFNFLACIYQRYCMQDKKSPNFQDLRSPTHETPSLLPRQVNKDASSINNFTNKNLANRRQQVLFWVLFHTTILLYLHFCTWEHCHPLLFTH